MTTIWHPVPLACLDAAEYAGAVLELLRRPVGGAAVPLLVEPGAAGLRTVLAGEAEPALHVMEKDAAASATQVLQAALDTAAARDAHRLCIVAAEDAYVVAGVAHAALASKRLVVLKAGQTLADIAGLLTSAQSVTVVMAPTSVARLGCDHFCQWLGQGGRQNGGAWGLLTASTLARLSNLVARIALRASPVAVSAVAYGMEQADIVPQCEPSLACAPLPHHPSPLTALLREEAKDLAIFVGHGRSYCAMGGNLCSLRQAATAGDRQCAGAYDCVFPAWPRIPASQLRCDWVMLDSCSTASFELAGPEQDRGLNLAVHLLDGFASAVISPARTNTPWSLTPYLVWVLARQGIAAGELLRQLNTLVGRQLSSADPYMLLGDPDARLVLADVATPRTASVISREHGCWRLGVPARIGTAEIYTCADVELVAAAATGALSCLAVAGDGERLVVSLLPAGAGDPVRLIGIWGGPVAEREVEIVVIQRAAFRHEVIQMAGRLLRNLAIDGHWQLDGADPVRDKAESLRALLTSIEPAVMACLRQPPLHAPQYSALLEAEQAVLGMCERVGREMIRFVAAAAQRQELWMYSHYASHPGMRAVGEVIAPDPCPVCGRVVHQRAYQVGLWPGRLRTVLECAGCMFISDTYEDSVAVRVDGPAAAYRGEWTTINLVGTNTLEHEAMMHVALVVDRMGQPLHLVEVEPEHRYVLLAAGQAFQMSFRIRLSPELPVHLYHVKGLSVIDGAVGWALKKLSLR